MYGSSTGQPRGDAVEHGATAHSWAVPNALVGVQELGHHRVVEPLHMGNVLQLVQKGLRTMTEVWQVSSELHASLTELVCCVRFPNHPHFPIWEVGSSSWSSSRRAPGDSQPECAPAPPQPQGCSNLFLRAAPPGSSKSAEELLQLGAIPCSGPGGARLRFSVVRLVGTLSCQPGQTHKRSKPMWKKFHLNQKT
ncbi:hypothetical protein BDK51DRAFT_29460 [Blyttiomyces helicus]|uniref:Uncharacterized protein n=1 Tax=Blyttiomyces helicus TaxID=388810 RepID=A0A4P9VY45_9FUNG|nr:hypothetical protein BDK51DRAFT_29460 [Blyttiomyces helicus]|eukprot:RKO83230.1 hypothetical protein BDK51DRAFT_29460 [Blyttiomyces helicus]